MKKILIGLVIVLSVSLGYLAGWNAGLKASPVSKPYAVNNLSTAHLNSDKLWSLIEEWRTKEGLPAYIKDQRICDIANNRILEVDKEIKENAPHKGFVDAVKDFPIRGGSFSENIVGAGSEEEALDKWLRSASHSAALRKSYTYSCISTKGPYAIQEFANF